MQWKALGVLLGVLLSMPHLELEACSRIFWNNSLNKVTARTMDLYVDEKPAFAVRPQGMVKEGSAGPNSVTWKSRYGSLVVTAFEGKAVSDGMNEKGLAAHLLYLHDTVYEQRDNRPGLSNTLWIEYLLDNFSSVNDALNAINSFQIVSTEIEGREWPLHVCLEDASGDSAILEYVNGKLVIHHGSQFAVATNEPPYDIQINNLQRYKYFGGQLPLPGDIDSMSRFVRCAAFLKTLPQPATTEESIGHIFGAIRTVQVPFGAKNSSDITSEVTWVTRWITVVDMTNLIYVFNSTSTPNIVWANLLDLNFSPGRPSKSLNLHDPSLVGNISNRF